MNLNKYLESNTHKKRILIVSDITKGQALIRRFEKKTGKIVKNVECMTLPQMINQIYLYYQADNGYEEDVEILDNTEAMILFRSILARNASSMQYFKDIKMFDLSTTKDIYGKLCLIRSNGWTEDELRSTKKKISDLKLLIFEYEKKLAEDKLLDAVTELKTVIERLSLESDYKEVIKDIFAADIVYVTEEADKFFGLQKKLLCMLASADEEISVYDGDISVDTIAKAIKEVKFYKGYGSYNEASYIANDILERELPFGDVLVMYNSPSQLPSLISALRGNGIGTRFISNHSAGDNAYISLVKRILNWAKEDYNEASLEAILSSPIMSVEVIDECGKKENVLARQSYFDYVLDAGNRREDSFTLGWGYQRNCDFVKHESVYADSDAIKSLLAMHNDMLDIFSDAGREYGDKNKVKPIEIYKKLIDFASRYTIINAEYATGMEGLKKLSRAVAFEDRAMVLGDVIDYINELIDGISIKETENATAVTVQCIDEWIVPERRYVYVCGLSLKDMQGRMIESPVLLDDEIDLYIGDGYKPTVKNDALLKEMNLYRTIMASDCEDITFGYSSYDTVAFCESNPSTFYRELLDVTKGASVKDISEFVYGNPSGAVRYDLPIGILDKPSFDIRLTTSSSSIERLLDCPKRYAYDKLMHIPSNVYSERSYSIWLNAAARGSFFHSIVEKYVDKILIKPSTESYLEKVDNKLIEEIAKDIEANMLVSVPVAFKGLADCETKELINYAIAYLQKLHDDLRASGWRCLMTEEDFVESSYKIMDYKKKEYEFIFSGTIDRVDYIYDGQNSIHVRIVDYKTGRKSSKENDQNLGKLMQYAIYEKALIETGHFIGEDEKKILFIEHVKNSIAKLEDIKCFDGVEIIFDYFEYAFPMEVEDNESLKIIKEDLAIYNTTRLKAILTAIDDRRNYPDHRDLYDSIVEYCSLYYSDDENLPLVGTNMVKSRSSELAYAEIHNCKYCEYGTLCDKRKAGEI